MSDARISFFDLPLLVQAKIVRENFSTVQKAFAISRMPEFSDMLESRHCWSDTSEEFFEFYGLLRRLRPGLYFAREGAWSHGFAVSVEDDAVRISLCCLDDMVSGLMSYDSRVKTDFRASFPEAVEFLKTFLKNYAYLDPRETGAYETPRGYFFVDYFKKTLHWLDGEVRSLDERGGCMISDLFGPRHATAVLMRDRTVRLTCLATVRWADYHCPCEKYLTVIRPSNPRELLRREVEKSDFFKFELRVGRGDVSFGAEGYRPESFRGFLNVELFERFARLGGAASFEI